MKPAYNKYGNKKVYDDGQKFDSEDEHDYWVCLQEWQEQGIIESFERQPRLILVPKCEINGKKQMAVTYTPDFLVEYPDGRKEYIDIKGFSTQQGDLRRKLYNYLSMQKDSPFFGIPLRWIALSFKHGDEDGWIDYDELQRIRAKNRKAKKGA